MNPYERFVLPRLIDAACGMGDVMRRRAELIPQARGEVLEVGMGTGLNLQYYDAGRVSRIVGVDPAAQMQTLARKRAAQIAIPVEMIAVGADGIASAADSYDTVVMTFTLCSIADPLPALVEMRRVLKPKGQLLFCEHGLSNEASVQRWQRRLTPWWKPIAGGCHLDRDIPGLLQQAGFALLELRQAYIAGPRPMTYLYQGAALKA
ncbi:class I SAM-dependent methyltransferase [Halopseudomonas sabulinigri]|uniref:Methyltransferase domain-containing protein n=1 Tax=Halopseudomonas sabulinigri TaxID=472181 RepID=A0ABP9ZUS2_9GAMM